MLYYDYLSCFILHFKRPFSRQAVWKLIRESTSTSTSSNGNKGKKKNLKEKIRITEDLMV